ncbi:hypothetical protein FS842_008877 [Serendipita sp. 407]|nr:hypothetical protein FS842_008877 [Serendipita sp. 407]
MSKIDQTLDPLRRKENYISRLKRMPASVVDLSAAAAETRFVACQLLETAPHSADDEHSRQLQMASVVRHAAQ